MEQKGVYMLKTLKDFLSFFGLLGTAATEFVGNLHPYLATHLDDQDENAIDVTKRPLNKTAQTFFPLVVTQDSSVSSGLYRLRTSSQVRSRHGDGECPGVRFAVGDNVYKAGYPRG